MKVKLVFLCLIFILLGISLGYCAETAQLTVFYSPSCLRCIEVKSEIIPGIEKEYAQKLKIEYRDISNMDDYMRLISLKEKYQPDLEITVPVFFCQGRFLNGKGEIARNLKAFVQGCLAKNQEETATVKTNQANLISYFKTFTPLTVIGAGLIDGINPCAFTVIVFFISFLALQGYRKKELLLIGLCFIFAVFLTYILLGLGIFGFLYRLSGFWKLAKIFNQAIGIFSIILGCLAIYDFLKFKKTGKTEGLALQLPTAVKNQIHKVIGMHYRLTRDSAQARKKNLSGLILSALITGFLVSILEAVCTGQTYLPTISFILKTAPLKIQAAGYLLLYNLMFILPLCVIFFFALLGVTSEQFSSFLKKRLLSIKILMAILFFGLGIFLIWRG